MNLNMGLLFWRKKPVVDPDGEAENDEADIEPMVWGSDDPEANAVSN